MLLDRVDAVIWIQTAFLGDIVLSTAAFELLRQLRPTIKQHLITTELGAQLLGGGAIVDSVHVFGKGKLGATGRVLRSIKGLHLNRERTLTLQLHRSLRSTLLAQRLGFPVLAYREAALAFLARFRVTRLRVLHEAQRCALLLEPLGAKREDVLAANPRLEALALRSELEASLPRKRPLISIVPGSTWGGKCWPIEYFCELVNRIGTDSGVGIVLLGAAGEVPLARTITAKYRGAAPLQDLSGRTTVRDLRALYTRFSLLISNDSAPLHFASAFAVPSIAIFGPTVPEQGFAPLAPGSKTVSYRGQLDCRPCGEHGPKLCPQGHFACMRNISVDEVFSHYRSLTI